MNLIKEEKLINENLDSFNYTQEKENEKTYNKLIFENQSIKKDVSLMEFYIQQIKKDFLYSTFFSFKFYIPTTAKIVKLFTLIIVLLFWETFFYFESKLEKINIKKQVSFY